MYDLLSSIEAGGCSAKLSAKELSDILAILPKASHPDLLIDIETHDDAGVYRINETTALVQTVDFFPPVCSDPYDFGQIAAANALSDVYAMGGTPLTAMNIMMFPSKKIPKEVFAQILLGGHDKVTEAGAVIVGGHTIDDYPPKYGLSVTGVIHPDHIMTNAAAEPGDCIILTKPIGTGIAIAGKKAGIASPELYERVVNSMKTLNRAAADVMMTYNVQCATDVTGFSLLGHALKMAMGSNCTISIESSQVPVFEGVRELAETGCLPGACFRNEEFARDYLLCAADVDYTSRMILFDAQTSGGLLFCIPREKMTSCITDLQAAGTLCNKVIGHVTEKKEFFLEVIS